jgi:DNA-binding CsgD family transcriptional regulator
LRDVGEDLFQELPLPQRHALEVALLRAPPAAGPIDRRAVSAGLLGILRHLAMSAPTLVAIDDLQWLDPSSARALAFAVRRLHEEPVAILGTTRAASPDATLDLSSGLPPDRVRIIELGPLDLDVLGEVLEDRLGERFLLPTLLRIHRASAGNPFYALEIARALAQQPAQTEPWRPLPVPDTLRALLRGRLTKLPDEVKRILPFVAAASSPSVALLTAAVRNRVEEALDRGVESGVLELQDGRVAFTHPLLASAVYGELPPGRRARLHARLGEVVPDPHERARHLALAAEGPDTAIARMLDEAGRVALRRGAPDAAAELLELARRLTPADRSQDAIAREQEAALCYFAAGDVDRAVEFLEQVVDWAAPGPGRAETLRRLGMIKAPVEGWPTAESLFRRGLAEAGSDPSLRAGIQRDLAYARLFTGDLASARRHAQGALKLAETTGEPSGLAESLQALAYIEFLLGRPRSRSLIERGLEIERRLHRDLPQGEGLPLLHHVLRPSFTHGQMLKYLNRFDDARSIFTALVGAAEGRGEESAIPVLLYHLAELECWAGNYREADRHAGRSVSAALQTGMPFYQAMAYYAAALVEAHVGHVDPAQSAAQKGLALAEGTGTFTTQVQNLSVLGFLGLSLGDPSGALRHLEAACGLVSSAGVRERTVFRFVPDLVEALLGMGRLKEADEWTLWLGEGPSARGRPWARAAAARCRGLVLAVGGDPVSSAEAFRSAISLAEGIGQPFELARTHLLAGVASRRFKKKARARENLTEAMRLFRELGAGLWEARAREELRRLGGRPSSPVDLTPTEWRVAELVAAGRSNREVAEALFMTTKTVEWNLSKVYRKLQIRSRTELATAIAGAGHRIADM